MLQNKQQSWSGLVHGFSRDAHSSPEAAAPNQSPCLKPKAHRHASLFWGDLFGTKRLWVQLGRTAALPVPSSVSLEQQRSLQSSQSCGMFLWDIQEASRASRNQQCSEAKNWLLFSFFYILQNCTGNPDLCFF